MIKISHRGNTAGPDLSTENDPRHIEKVIRAGFDCEVDLWVHDKQALLGHDAGAYEITARWLDKFEHSLWVHCKNFAALEFMNENLPRSNFFWHEDDRFTLTSRGFIWTYPDQPTGRTSVLVSLGPKEASRKAQMCAGLCSDYILEY